MYFDVFDQVKAAAASPAGALKERAQTPGSHVARLRAGSLATLRGIAVTGTDFSGFSGPEKEPYRLGWQFNMSDDDAGEPGGQLLARAMPSRILFNAGLALPAHGRTR
jgi:hypothetical protein